ncbi:DNA-binding protein [Kineosporia sp. J2-2]|uniref:DNA-binding protein n=1 Tax=Kineosporia corallincola TaxID=2835133 RepID=A0ABS5TLK6_9ACTN|nr:Rv2175c family DNA-binding protein [Kineosporia corallincola]MBT0771056.1 DNA-binding protein [Kineosporia corallincola]
MSDTPQKTSDVLSDGPEGERVWLPLPDVAEQLGIDFGKVRRLLQERVLIGMRRGERKIMCVPAELLKDGAPLPDLQGTLVVLADSGFSDEEALRWLFTDDDYPGTPVDALRTGHRKTEVRRRAQALAF